jgi:hypothetical protein
VCDVGHLTLDFSKTVTTHVPDREKVWRTNGAPKLLILAADTMRLVVEPFAPSAARLTISITYALPHPWFWRLVGRLLARPSSRWCLRRKCRDAGRALEAPARA